MYAGVGTTTALPAPTSSRRKISYASNTSGHHADDVRIHVPAVVAFLPAGARLGHAALPRFGNVTEFAMVAGAVDGLLDARRQAVVHFRDERADTAGVAGPLVGTDFGQICGGGAIDGIGIKAGKNTILLFHAFQHSRRPVTRVAMP